MTSSNLPTSTPWWALLRVMLPTALIFTSMAIVPPSVDSLVRVAYSMGNREVGWFFLVHSLPNLFAFGVLIGVLSDRWGRRLPLAIAMTFGTGITTILHPWITSYGWLLGLRFVDGVFGIAALGMLMARALDLSRYGNRAFTMGIYLASIPVGYLTGSFLVAAVGGFSLPLVFAIVGGMVMVVSLLMCIDLRRPESPGTPHPSVKALIRSMAEARQLWFPIGFGFVDKFTFGCITLLTTLALSDEYNLSPIVYGGSALGLLWVAYLLASAPAGWLVSRIGPWYAVALGSGGFGLSLCALLLFGNPTLFIAMMVSSGVFIALQTIPTFTLVGRFSRDGDRGTAVCTYNFVGSIGLILGLGFSGFASEQWGYFPTFMVAGVLQILCAIVAFVKARIEHGRDTTSLTPLRRGSTQPTNENITSRGKSPALKGKTV
ncbi:MAG: MFS transporter [Candidatus Sumerlaeia bacterium]|nr:MFS transporter [Candidatus Sumerlaeia bacterium]